MPETDRKNIVVIGGGTGTYSLMQGLKSHWREYNLTKIVSMTDCGGSTGRLRDEFGQLPVGDVRMSLAALAPTVEEDQQLLRELFLYRFDKGNGLSGHNFGNLFLVALTEILGNEAKAIKAAARLLRIRGQVLPVTEHQAHLVARYDDGVEAMGEHLIDEPPTERYDHRIIDLRTDVVTEITTEVFESITKADLVVLGPGDIYTSLLANCIIGGMPEALQQTTAKLAFVANLMTKPGQTTGMSVTDHVNEISRYITRTPDVVVVNTSTVTPQLLEKYAAAKQYPVVDDADKLSCYVIRADLLSDEIIAPQPGDALQRSLVRGDAKKMAEVILKLVE